ncbi:phospholipid methyltransferase [Paenibacillus sp. LHD-38]|uniref:class I SAM-dependent methyltransferase n=1 Tax=Paenibacillus sp. LHD-38 TaxID=3072143 RepID=UPI00280EB8A8|nr:phospholipid methyltransferase [Paenibacillus sp. LHD-38]MDQ8733662.1 phospholipid methyltransferase [Paenibacillus sp. LHD-38]
MGINKSILEKILFMFKFFYKPGQMGSVTPSSNYLGRKMVESVPWQAVNHIAELGAGTGAITKHIKKAASSQTNILLFEKDPYMFKALKDAYPRFLIFQNTLELHEALAQEGIEQLDCIISGLPFFNFTHAYRTALLEQITASLRDDGLFIAFQYSQQMKKQLSFYFYIDEIIFVPFNIPPAFVYVCRKKQRLESEEG